MKSLNSWALNVCVVTIVTGVLLALVPNGKQKSTLRLVVVTSVVFCFMQPLFGVVDESELNMDFSSVNINTSVAAELIEGEVLEYAAHELETELTDCLASCGYTVKNARIQLQKYNDGTVEVKSVYIDGLTDEVEKNEVRKKVKELLGEGAEVEFDRRN